MPYEISSLAYLTYALIGTGGVLLASRVMREKVVRSPSIRSILAMAPLFVPLVILIWVRPDLSDLTLRTEGIAEMLARHIILSLSPVQALNPWMLLSFIRLEMLIFGLVAQFSGLLLMAGVGAATALLLFSRFLGEWFVRRTQGTIPIERGEIPELDRMVLNLARKAGIPAPRILLIEDLRPQAFTIGGGRSASLTFSTGLLMAAGPKELEAITAHEIAHLKGNDNQLRLLLNWMKAVSFYNPFAHMAAADAAREREFAADTGAVELVAEPESLVKGLQLASGKAEHGGGIACFSNLVSASLFASHHPPPDERIRAASKSCALPGKARRAAWAAMAILLVLGSILLPATVARSLQPPNPMPPPTDGGPSVLEARKHLMLIPIPAPSASTAPEASRFVPERPSGHQHGVPCVSMADWPPEPNSQPKIPPTPHADGLDSPPDTSQPYGLLCAADLATIIIRNIYQI